MMKELQQGEVVGVASENVSIISQAEALRHNLTKQKEVLEQEIDLLEGQLSKKKEYLAKIEGGLEVIEVVCILQLQVISL